MDNIFVPMVVLAILGGATSHYFHKKKIKAMQQSFTRDHVGSMTALADAAVEVMAVDYGADLKEAMSKLIAAAQTRNPGIRGLGQMPTDMSAQYAHIEKLRAKRKETASDTKPAG